MSAATSSGRETGTAWDASTSTILAPAGAGQRDSAPVGPLAAAWERAQSRA